jgi:CheY-like chemotaxis protein
MSALRKVLVVDDDPVVGKSFNRVLSKDKGYVVVTAQNAAEALERIREQEYDVVFTDIKMPGMDGVELTERVKAAKPWTPVVIITGYGTTANETRAKAAGVADFMRKPLSPEMIQESAEHALLQMPEAVTAPEPIELTTLAQPQAAAKGNPIKNIALFLAAPFISLVYALTLPLAGMAMLAWLAGQALYAKPAGKKVMDQIKNVTLFVGAPFIGLAYAVMLPVVGVATLAWIGAQALVAQPATKTTLRFVRQAGVVATTPIIGLVYAVTLPLVGTAMLLWIGAQALMAKPVAA